MKILWVTSMLFGYHNDLMGKRIKSNSGSWLTAAYASAKESKDIELFILTSSTTKEILSVKHDNVTFIVIPGGGAQMFDLDSFENRTNLKLAEEKIQPDLLILWGTETKLAYAALQVFNNIPSAVYMQGVMRSIYEHYYDGVPNKYKRYTLRDYINALNPKSQYHIFEDQSKIENIILKYVDGIIIENDWCEDVCRSVNPNLLVFRNKLPIQECFFDKRWNIESINKYTIFTNAGGYPIKGHHILFSALALVKKAYPNFKCYVPGQTLTSYDTLKSRNGYIAYLKRIIEENDLKDNIIYTGALSTAEMAEYLAKSHVYVMPSIMENHSSSLIESLIVGTPSISSLVGGTASIIKHNVNGLLYNSLDVESLAGSIIRIFSNKDFAEELSNGTTELRNSRRTNFGEEMNSIYKVLIKPTFK